MKNVIFLSPPAAGKGTMSEYLVEHYSYQHISTGNMLRKKALIDADIAALLKSGALVDDETMLSLLKETLSTLDPNRPFILDGLPRTLHQAQVLDIILSGLKDMDYVVVYIDVKEEILFRRVLGRRICSKCHKTFNSEVVEFQPKVDNQCDSCGSPLITRSDDTLESYQIRYQHYKKSTHPLIEYYKKMGRLKVIENNAVDQTKTLQKLVGVLSD